MVIYMGKTDISKYSEIKSGNHNEKVVATTINTMEPNNKSWRFLLSTKPRNMFRIPTGATFFYFGIAACLFYSKKSIFQLGSRADSYRSTGEDF